MTGSRPASPTDVQQAADLMRGRRVTVLTGAGISTESGIPDYRGPNGPRRKTSPIQYRDFIAHESTRARYWARSAVGWPIFSSALPNDGHRAIAQLEEGGIVQGIITQNVDRLHQAAGSGNVIELHGAMSEVVCLRCSSVESRARLQQRLLAMNPGWNVEMQRAAPDGDAELPEELSRGFRVPTCLCCGGTVKPNVVLFGENVPRRLVDASFSLLDQAEVLLVAGSSLTVYSGFRFVDRAHRLGIPIIIANDGWTRGDSMADVRISARLGTVLPVLAGSLLVGSRTRVD